MTSGKTYQDYLRDVQAISVPHKQAHDRDMQNAKAWMETMSRIFRDGLESPMPAYEKKLKKSGASLFGVAFGLAARAKPGSLGEKVAGAALDLLRPTLPDIENIPGAKEYDKAVADAVRVTNVFARRLAKGKVGMYELEGVANGGGLAEQHADPGLSGMGTILKAVAESTHSARWPAFERQLDDVDNQCRAIAVEGLRAYLKENPEAAAVVHALKACHSATAEQLSEATGLDVTKEKMERISQDLYALYRGWNTMGGPVQGYANAPEQFHFSARQEEHDVVASFAPKKPAPKLPGAAP